MVVDVDEPYSVRKGTPDDLVEMSSFVDHKNVVFRRTLFLVVFLLLFSMRNRVSRVAGSHHKQFAFQPYTFSFPCAKSITVISGRPDLRNFDV